MLNLSYNNISEQSLNEVLDKLVDAQLSEIKFRGVNLADSSLQKLIDVI